METAEDHGVSAVTDIVQYRDTNRPQEIKLTI